jgi:hypothetical protein
MFQNKLKNGRLMIKHYLFISEKNCHVRTTNTVGRNKTHSSLKLKKKTCNLQFTMQHADITIVKVQ